MKKRYIGILVTMILASFPGNTVPCSDLNTQLVLGTFALIHQPTSKLVAFKQVKMSLLLTQQALPQIDDGVAISPLALFEVSDKEFANGTNDATRETLGRVDRAALISWSKVPNSCFLLWFSSDLLMMTLNQVLGQNAQGDLELGSDNRAYGGLEILLVRH